MNILQVLYRAMYNGNTIKIIDNNVGLQCNAVSWRLDTDRDN